MNNLAAYDAEKDPTSAKLYVVDVTSTTKSQGLSIDANDSEKYEDHSSDFEFPEGGQKAWLTMLGGFLVQYASFGYINAFGVYQDFYIREYLNHSTPSAIGWIGGMQVFLNFAVGAFTGRLFDRGYFYHLMGASLLLQAISLFMLSLSHQNAYYQVFLTHGLLLGLSSGLSYVPSLSIPNHYFCTKRPFATGIISAGSALGAVLHPIMLNKLFESKLGFHNTVRLSAGLNAFLFIIALGLMRTRLPPKPVQTFPVFQWFKEPVYLLITLGGFFCFLGLYFPIFYLQVDGILHGVDTNLTFYSISILNVASIVGRILPGYLAPHLGVLNLDAICTIFAGIVCFFMVAVKDVIGVVLFAIFFGLFSGAAVALTAPTLAAISDDINEMGTRLGVYLGLGGIFGLVSQPIAGALLTAEYHWIRPSLFAGITVVVGGVLVGLGRQIIARERGSQVV